MKLLTAMIAAVALLAGCASKPAVKEIPLEPLPAVSVAFDVETGELSLGELAQPSPSKAESDLLYEVEIRIVVGSRDEVEAFFGPAVATVDAWQALESEIDMVAIQRRGLEVKTVPTIRAVPGQSGILVITRQVAYGSGFVNFSEGPEPRAIPPEEPFEGIAVALTAEAVDERSVAIDLDLVLLDKVQPEPETTISLAGREIKAQTPVVYHKRLLCDGSLAADRILVVTGMNDDEAVRVVLMKVTRKSAAGTAGGK